ncbi:MAG: beta-galactosidase, partial [Candidatus Pacebacteria bacterium]|nr:beta-galactosidase [Candidatus Paceibacterota bacterium]
MRKTIAKFRLRRMRMFLVAGMACFGTPLFARAGVKGFPPDQPGEIRHPDALRPAPTVVTPHTPWARDNGGGTTKALFIAPRGVLREVVELYQRTDLDYRVVATDSSKALSGSKKGAKRLIWGTRRADEVLTDLDAALREDYDVIVVGNLLPGLLPGKAWNVIGRHVRRGGGLIACPAKGTDEDNESLHNLVGEAQALTFPNTVGNAFPAPVRDAYLAGWGTGESLPFDTYTLGRGRVVVSRYVPGKWSMVVPGVSVRDNLENRCLFDYQHAVSARVLLWAARRLPGEEMNPFSVSSEVTANSAAVTVDWTTADDHTDVTWLELRVRDKHNHDLYRAVLPASEGVRFDVPLQALPVGEHFVDIWFRDARNRTLDWRTTMLSVADPQGIAELSAEPDFVTPELPVTAVIDLKQKLAKDESLALSIRDFHGRVTARKAVRGETGDTFEVKVNVGTPLSIICDLDVELWRGNRLVDRKEAEIAVDQPPKGPGWDDFSWLYWCFRDNVVPQQAMRRLLPYGLDRVLVERGSVDRHVEETRLVAKTLNAKSYPYAWGLQKIPHQMNPDGLVRKMTELAPKLDKYSCDTVNLGDENSLSRDHKAFSKRMKPTFQEAMKEQYETLDALNAAWGTDFTEWGQVTGIDLEGAQKIGQRTRFFDTRRYMDTIFARFHKLGVEAAQQASSHYRVGFEGVWRTEWWRGYDWQKIMSSVNLIGNYAFAPAEADIVGSFKPDDLYWTLWNGAYMDVHNRWFQGWVPWHCLLQGMNATAWWCSLPGSAHANPFHIFYPDLRISPEVLPFLESVREIKSGLGKLLIGAERYDYGIGIHYSQASIYADALDDYGFNTPGKGVPSRIQNSWLNFLYGLGDGGFQGRFVSYAQVEQGDFGDAKVVILPFSQAISRRE